MDKEIPRAPDFAFHEQGNIWRAAGSPTTGAARQIILPSRRMGKSLYASQFSDDRRFTHGDPPVRSGHRQHPGNARPGFSLWYDEYDDLPVLSSGGGDYFSRSLFPMWAILTAILFFLSLQYHLQTGAFLTLFAILNMVFAAIVTIDRRDS